MRSVDIEKAGSVILSRLIPVLPECCRPVDHLQPVLTTLSVQFDMRGSIHWGQGRIAIRPPSIGNSSPVIQRASSLAR